MIEEKKLILEKVQEWIQTSPYQIIVDYTGLRVDEFSELRKRLDETSAKLHVVKNTFLRRVLSDSKLPDFNGALKGQTALVYGDSDICASAKVLKNFEAEFQRPKIRAGILDGKELSADEVLTLASLPSREVLLSQLLSLINTPATSLVRLLNTPASQLAQVVKAKSEKGGDA